MPRNKKGLPPQKQEIFHVFENHSISREEVALTAPEVIDQAYTDNPHLFGSKPSPSAASALMVEIYRRVKGLHRVPHGHGYRYFYNPDIKLPKTTPRRRKHDIAQSVKVRAAKNHDEFLVVKRADGSTAGVMKDGILYDTLESLLTALNYKLRR